MRARSYYKGSVPLLKEFGEMILEEEKIENQKFDEGKPIAQLSTES